MGWKSRWSARYPPHKRSRISRLTSAQIGMTASAYLAGAILGALIFGQLTDRYGRKKLFAITLGLYIVSALLTGSAWNFWSFAHFAS